MSPCVAACASTRCSVHARPTCSPVWDRRDWFSDDAWTTLLSSVYTVSSDSNRVGLRLTGAALRRRRRDELPSEGLVRGALQIPPSGAPVLFLADHPVTGGYPVLAYVDDPDVDRCAQLRPGQRVSFRVRAEQARTTPP
jgi:allophanate hydrolase subunit 2